MQSLKNIFRLFHINYVLAKHGLEEIVLALKIFAPLRFLIYLNPWYWIKNKNIPRAVRLRLALEELGPIFVKFGQTLSTRRDLLPDDVADELTKLQDKVPPFPNAIPLLEKIYGANLQTLFKEVEEYPAASASIAQVHFATLLDGREVVIKVLRPNIDKIIKRDISLLYMAARLGERYSRVGKRLHAVEVVAEFENTIINELDLLRESANASSLRRNFMNSQQLYIPEIYWPYARDSAIVMERISGIPIADIATLKDHNINLKKLAETGVEIFFTQVFRDCFFHADMHPGNIFVSTKNPQNPQYIAVDFGIMGSLSPEDQRYLAENMLAFFKRDYRRVAVLHLESGWIPSNTRLEEFESAIRTVCEPIFERPLKDISFGRLLLKLFQAGRHFSMEIQPQLLLLQKTLLHVEGLGRQLYPELDLWQTAKPFLENWLTTQVGPKAFLHKMKDYFPLWAEQFPEIPGLLYATLKKENSQYSSGIKPQLSSLSEKNPPTKFLNKCRFKLGLGLGFLLSGISLLTLLKSDFVSVSYYDLGIGMSIAGFVLLILYEIRKN